MTDEEAPAADPDDLDFTDDERVAEIDEGRYVVGTDGRPTVRRERATDPGGPSDTDESNDQGGGPGFHAPAERKRAAEREPTTPTAGGSNAGDAGTPTAVDRQAVSRWLATSFDDDGFAYGFDATLHTEGETTRHRMVSNDVSATFDTLLGWFASNAGSDTSPSEALGLLLVAADTPVDVPTLALTRFASKHGLSPDDPIADLVAAAEEAGGFRIE